jgi:hypothetical protein
MEAFFPDSILGFELPPPPNCEQAPDGLSCCCCNRCGVGGCDIQCVPCNCCMHTRCCGVSENKLIDTCPVCHQPATGLRLIPMAFNEIDRAQAEAANTRLSEKRGKKRLNATVTRLNPLLNAREGTNDELGKSNAAESNELRTGRWTTEETEYCDQLIELFEGKSMIRSSKPITERKIVSRRLAPSCSSWPDSNPGRNQIERFSVQHAQIKAV